MTWYAIHTTSDGALVSVGTIVADPLPVGLSVVVLGQVRPTGTWNPATRAFDPSPVVKGELTRRAFWRRFTPAEREALQNVRATAVQQARKDKIAAFLDYIADGVDLDDAYIVGAVQALEAFGVLPAGRAAEILA